MSPHYEPCPVSSVVVAISLLALGETQSALDAAPMRRAAKKRLSAFTAAAVERAKLGAASRLRDPECLKVLTDFKDGSGRTLDQSLETWNLSAADYIRAIAFDDGSSFPSCRRASVLLVAAPGLPMVYVCPPNVGARGSRFGQVQLDNPALAEAMVIHEMLHTLGLGENPPTTFEITERVRKRCR